MLKLSKIIFFTAIAVVVSYFIWLLFSYLASIIPWYVSLISLSTGVLMYFSGRYFLKKKYVLKRIGNRVILDTPILADTLVIIGSIIIILSVITSKWIFILSQGSGWDDFLMKCFTVLFIAFGLTYLVFNFFQLKHSLNDRIEISFDEFRFDDALSNTYKIYKKVDLFEIQLLKEFKDQSSGKEKLINQSKFEYNSRYFHLSLLVKLKPIENQEEPVQIKLDPSVMNVDLSIFVEALESMNYFIVRRSKYDNSDQLWDGHNFDDGPYSKA